MLAVNKENAWNTRETLKIYIAEKPTKMKCAEFDIPWEFLSREWSHSFVLQSKLAWTWRWARSGLRGTADKIVRRTENECENITGRQRVKQRQINKSINCISRHTCMTHSRGCCLHLSRWCIFLRWICTYWILEWQCTLRRSWVETLKATPSRTKTVCFGFYVAPVMLWWQIVRTWQQQQQQVMTSNSLQSLYYTVYPLCCARQTLERRDINRCKKKNNN